MMIWSYKIAMNDGVKRAYGARVTVSLPGIGETTAVYRFQGGEGQQCAVVDLRTGAIIARIEEHHTGYLQERARAAVREKLDGFTVEQIRRTLDTPPTLNEHPETLS